MVFYIHNPSRRREGLVAINLRHVMKAVIREGRYLGEIRTWKRHSLADEKWWSSNNLFTFVLFENLGAP